MACIAGILISLHEGEGAAGDCFRSLGDNTSSLVWLQKSNFAADGEHASHSALARHFALTIADYKVGHFSQWFPGKDNEVADILSRDHTRTDQNLTKYIKFLYTKQVSETFQISPLPPEIHSWLDYWVLHTPDSMPSPTIRRRKPVSTSKTGSLSSTNASSMTTYSWTPTVPSTSKNYLEPTCTRYEVKDSPKVQSDMVTWLRAHAAPPSIVYERPSAQMVNPIRRWTQTERLRSFYTTNFEDTQTRTPPPSNRNRSRSL